jgi:hypothetical protein
VWKRAVYAGASPLIPVVRLRRVLADIRRTQRAAELLPRILPALAIGVTASGVGEGVGYAFGGGRAAARVMTIELHKLANIRDGEQIVTGRA